jgi:hypothetical protein
MRSAFRSALQVLGTAAALAGCTNIDTGSTAQDENGDQKGGGGGRFNGTTFADVYLTHANADLLQTSNTSWTLTKTGSVDTAQQTVTWTIKTTRGATVGGNLVVDGDLNLTNIGNGPASLGNIVVNLQVHQTDHHHHGWGWGWGGYHGHGGHGFHTGDHDEWTTVASDVANATLDINATSANVVASENTERQGTFTTGPGSGKLFFLDRATNSVFSLVPEVSLPPFSQTPLLFSASFDNNVLAIPQDADVRVEVIVTFGNHALGGPGSGTNIDINGNGVIDPDEHRVRSVSNLFDLDVPATLAANSSLTTMDAIADITTTGTVTFSNAHIDLQTGIVTADYNPGSSGGSITNCAHATGNGISDPVGSIIYTIVAPANLTACDTEVVHQATCTAGTQGCGWHDNDIVTWSQVAWGGTPAPGNISNELENNFDNVFGADGDLMEIGIPGSSGYSIIFDSADAIIAYLPASGAPAALTADLLDPVSTASGSFGGEVATMELNISFNDAGLLEGTSGLRLGDLTVCNLTGSQAPLNGQIVRNILTQADTLLGGGTGTVSIQDMFTVTNEIDMSFNGGPVSTFAQQSLFNGACPP